jgi:hypothetical protein
MSKFYFWVAIYTATRTDEKSHHIHYGGCRKITECVTLHLETAVSIQAEATEIEFFFSDLWEVFYSWKHIYWLANSG